MATRTAATVDDVLRLASAGQRYELVDGELVEMAPTGFEHGKIELTLGQLINAHVLRNHLGDVVVGEVLFQLDRTGRLARAADVAFVSNATLAGQPSPRGAFIGAPDLVVEIVSPGNQADDLQRKVEQWLAHGTQLVLVVYPEQRSVVLWHGREAVSLREDEDLTLESVLPGFRCKVGDLFPPSRESDSPAHDQGTN